MDRDTTYSNRMKTLEINPHHPLIKDLLRRIKTSKDDKKNFCML